MYKLTLFRSDGTVYDTHHHDTYDEAVQHGNYHVKTNAEVASYEVDGDEE